MTNVLKKNLDKQISLLPKEIKYCTKCVVSNQRPRMIFDKEGVCGACTYAEIKNSQINWEKREKELKELCDKHRRNDGRFDVIVPSSGGKDSARVAWELKKKYNMHPLTITWAPFEYTPIGYKNFRDFIKTGGFNNLMAWQNGKVHKKLAKLAFEAVGDAWQPFTYGQVSYAFHIAKAFDIKLVFFGENGEAEYSGDPRVYNLKGMPFEIWAEQYFKGATVRDLIKYGVEETNYFTKKDYDESDLTFYEPPKIEELKNKDIQFHWFSYYKKWIPQENYYLASEHTGFIANPEGRSEGTYSKYASLDDQTDGFHFYLAFIKFGISRATSDAAHEIRDGHIDRKEGEALVKRYDGEFPNKYFKEFLEYIEITEEHFWEIVNKYRTPHVWKHVNGEWRLRTPIYEEKEGEIPIYVSSLPKSSYKFANICENPELYKKEINIKIENKEIGVGKPCYIIAEAGINHNGNMDLAKKMVDVAIESGADAIKFQTFKAKDICTSTATQADYQVKNTGVKESQQDMLCKLELTDDNHNELEAYCKEKGIIFCSTPHSSIKDVDLLDPLVPLFKIGSGDLTNLPFLNYVGKKGKPVILATGMGTLEEVKEAYSSILDSGNDQVVILHATSNYPFTPQEANLKVLETLRKNFPTIIGYSDNGNRFDIPLLATLMGAKVIEKHFTLDKNLPGPDQISSFDPLELKKLIKGIRFAEKNLAESRKISFNSVEELQQNLSQIATKIGISVDLSLVPTILGDGIKLPSKAENEIAKVARKSLVAAKDLSEGHIFAEGDLLAKRPGDGVSPKWMYGKHNIILGKRLKLSLQRDQLISLEDLE